MRFKSNLPPTDNGPEDLRKRMEKEYYKQMKRQMQFKFTRAELESWLYQIAFNNCGNSLGDACEEIISRLDGFERFVIDKRKEGNQ